jgi:hypothetical protein
MTITILSVKNSAMYIKKPAKMGIYLKQAEIK